MEYRKLTELKELPGNPRTIQDKSFKTLCKSIQENKEYFEARPLILSDRTGELIIIAGNQRFKAATHLNFPEVPTYLLSGLSEAKEKEIIIRDNVNNGEWEWDILNTGSWGEISELAGWGLDFPTDFEQPEEVLEAEEDDYEVPEGGIKTDIVLGDLFEIGEHRLLCGDSTCSDAVVKLMDGKKADMVFTSPPYNGNTSVGFAKGGMKNTNLYENNATDDKTDEDYIQFNADIFSTIKTIAADDLVILYNINYNRNSPSLYIDVVEKARNLFSLVETIIWEKSMAISLAGDNLTRIFEFVFLFYNGNDKPKMNKTHTNECVKNLWKISNVGANHDIHKACFPVKLVEQGISLYAKDGAILYEPFTGSGTTMIASHQLKRKCYGMELDPRYCQVIVNRMLKLDPSLKVKLNGQPYKLTEN